MLRELLRLVEAADGPITLAELGRELNVDVAVLDGMLQHWVRKGRLVTDSGTAKSCAGGCGCMSVGGGCGSCAGMAACPFVARLPVVYRLKLDE
ncbi:MAG TPA: FeoC-like transcriptional regulator [Promineifilum sp.]|nr:FeoC-like transcriptional regulator [Promineifilum sp.]